MALLALSHTSVEHQLYQAMLAETITGRKRAGAFGVRRLMGLTGLRSYSSIRRGRAGLLKKLSIEYVGNDEPPQRANYLVFSPEEIFARRRAAGIAPYPGGVAAYGESAAFNLVIKRLLRRRDLSRHEALVILCCVEGLTNAGIGGRLEISEQTVKYHLRHIFTKFGVNRRTELVSRLLTNEWR